MTDVPIILDVDDEEERLREQGDEDQQTAVFKGLRAHLEHAKSRASSFSSQYEINWQFLLGENHWPVPKNAIAAAYVAQNNSMTVRNWLFATADHKAGLLLAERNDITAIPTGAPIDIQQRWQIQEVMIEEARRAKLAEHTEDVLWDGMACGKGYTRLVAVADPRLDVKKIIYESLRPDRVFVDPDADRLSRADVVHYEDWFPMAKLRQAFPDTWKKVRPTKLPINTTEDWKKGNSSYRSKSDEELLSGGGGREYTIPSTGGLEELGKTICFSWIKNEEVIQEMEERIVYGQKEVCLCADCGCAFEPTPMNADEVQPEMMGMEMCPTCGGTAIATTTVPNAQKEQVPGMRKFVYPYGRLVVHCDDGILFDGKNPDEIDEVFPISEYDHYRVPHRFHGYGEVQHLRSTQLNANRNIAQLYDYLRTAVNGVLEYPDRAEIFRNISNLPNAKVGLPVNLIGLARYLPPAPFNMNAFLYAEESIKRDFQQMSGITDISTGVAPSAPTSGKEVQARVAAGGIRMNGHRNRLSAYKTDLLTKHFQMAWQHSKMARFYPVRNSQGAFNPEAIILQNLPRSTRIVVSTFPEDAERNKLTAQVLQEWTAGGVIPFWPDLLLPAAGVPQYDANAIQQRIALMQQEQANRERAATEQEFSGGPEEEAMPQ